MLWISFCPVLDWAIEQRFCMLQASMLIELISEEPLYKYILVTGSIIFSSAKMSNHKSSKLTNSLKYPHKEVDGCNSKNK